MITLVLFASLTLQTSAAVLALRLVRVTDRAVAWTLIAIALVLMALRRAVPLFHLIGEHTEVTHDPVNEVIGLVLSTLMVVGVAGIAPVFSSHRQTQGALHQSRQMLRLVLDSIPQRVFWKDRELRYLGGNRNAALDAGLDDSSELVGKTDFDLAWRGMAESYRSDDRQVVETGVGKVRFDEKMTRPDGSTRWLRTDKVPLRDEAGKVFGILGVYEDITNQLQAEESLRQSEEKLRKILDSVSFGVVIIGQDKKTRTANRAALAMMGTRTESELVGRRCTETMCLAKHDECPILDLGQTLDKSERVLMDAQGGIIPVLKSVVPITLGTDEVLLESFIDISTRKRAEEALRDSEIRLQLLLDSTAEGIFGIDRLGLCTFCNPACLRLLGYGRPEELLGKNMHELTHHTRADGTTCPENECRIHSVFSQGEGVHADDEVLWKADRSSLPVEYWS